jgi:hypothetical protein
MNIISDIIISCRHKKFVAKQRTLQLNRQLNILCVFTFDVRLLLNAAVINTDETQGKKKTEKKNFVEG